MDENILKEKYIEALKEKLNKAQSSYEIAKKDTIEAEGRMVTRYDSTKTETAWLADGYLKDVLELREMISSLESNIEFANLGDTVKVDIYQKNEYVGMDSIQLDMNLLNSNKSLFLLILGSSINKKHIYENKNEYIEYHVREIEKVEFKDAIGINSTVVLEDEYGDQDYYYIVNYLGGMVIENDGKKIFCVSKQTPIAVALFGKGVGDTVRPNPDSDYTCTIRELI